jgi:hypothetical protein
LRRNLLRTGDVLKARGASLKALGQSSLRSARATAANHGICGPQRGALGTRRMIARFGRRSAAWCVALLLGAAAVALAGCGGVGSLLVDPGQFDSYHCNDLVGQLKVLDAREAQLRNLVARASQATGGTVIGAMTYRTEIETIAAKRKLIQQQATEKKCELTQNSQSDQVVH